MAKRKSALFMTVGLGGNSQERIDSLAHGMLDTIIDGNFDYVVLFGSEKSKSTIESLKRQYIERFNENPDDEDLDEFDYYEFIQEDNVNDFNDYYKVIRSKIVELQDEYNIKINYTPGTKTMSISAAIASLVFRKKLRLIDGERGENTTVQSGTERHVDFSLYVVYDEILIKRIKEAFNRHQDDFGKVLIDELTIENNQKEAFETLFNIYSNWDNINFEEAYSCFEDGFNSKFPELSFKLGLNKKALRLVNPIPVKKNGLISGFTYDKNYEIYILASIINNAKRRAKEKKYDDAIARLYRSLEYIGQIKLRQYGIDSDEVNVDRLSELGADEEFIDDLKNYSDDGIIKSGLNLDFIILSELNDDLGKYYCENKKKITGQLSSRNYSVLAHGLESKTKKDYDDFEKTVLTFAHLLHKDMDRFLEETEFPKFNI